VVIDIIHRNVPLVTNYTATLSASLRTGVGNRLLALVLFVLIHYTEML